MHMDTDYVVDVVLMIVTNYLLGISVETEFSSPIYNPENPERNTHQIVYRHSCLRVGSHVDYSGRGS